MKLDLDTEVRYTSGQRAGFLRRVVVNENEEVSEAVLETDQLISKKYIVPVHLLAEGPGGVTTLNLDPDDLDTLEEYEEQQVPALTTDWEISDDAFAVGSLFPATVYQPIIPISEVSNIPEGSLEISQGTEIWCADSEDRWGVVDQLVTGDDERVQWIVGRPDDTEARELLIPIELVRDTDAMRVTLNCVVADLATYTQPFLDEFKEPEEE